MSFDDDHVLVDLRQRFDEVLDALEATGGWITARVKAPVLILGSLEGVESGIRQLGSAPIELDAERRGIPEAKVPTIGKALRGETTTG